MFPLRNVNIHQIAVPHLTAPILIYRQYVSNLIDSEKGQIDMLNLANIWSSAPKYRIGILILAPILYFLVSTVVDAKPRDDGVSKINSYSLVWNIAGDE